MQYWNNNVSVHICSVHSLEKDSKRHLHKNGIKELYDTFNRMESRLISILFLTTFILDKIHI